MVYRTESVCETCGGQVDRLFPEFKLPELLFEGRDLTRDRRFKIH